MIAVPPFPLPFDPTMAVLLIPLFGVALLAVLPFYRLGARLNVLLTFATLLSAL